MFGFSLPKLLLLIILIIIIWNIFKLIEKKNKRKNDDKDNLFDRKKEKDESLIECQQCGNFYSNNLPNGCPICLNND